MPEHLHTFLKLQSTLRRRQREALRDLGFAKFAEGESLPGTTDLLQLSIDDYHHVLYQNVVKIGRVSMYGCVSGFCATFYMENWYQVLVPGAGDRSRHQT